MDSFNVSYMKCFILKTFAVHVLTLPKVKLFEFLFANSGFLFIKITSQTFRRISSLKMKDNTAFSVKQKHACLTKMKNFREEGYFTSFHSKTSTSLFHFNQLLPQLCLLFPNLASEPPQVLHAPCLSVRVSPPTCCTFEEGRRTATGAVWQWGGQAVPTAGRNTAAQEPSLADAWRSSLFRRGTGSFSMVWSGLS